MKPISFILNFLPVLPKVLVRLLWFTIKKKTFLFNGFRATNTVCIDGALNQLIWYIENPIFITVSNSNKIYFNANDFIFKVSRLETDFMLKAYTLKGIEKYKTSIKVLCLKQKSYDGLLLSENTIKLKRKTIKLKENRLIANKLSKVRNTQLNRGNTSIMPKSIRVNRFENDKLNLVLDSISKSKNKQELTQLKQEI